MAQALIPLGQNAPRLWLVTRGVAPIDDAPSEASIVQAALWGFSRVLGNEHPEIRSTVVDLSRDPDTSELLSLFDEFSVEDDGEREVALRGAARYVQRAARRSTKLASERRTASPESPVALQVARPGRLDRGRGCRAPKLDPSRLPAAGAGDLDPRRGGRRVRPLGRHSP